MFGTVSKWIGVYNIWYYGVFMALNGRYSSSKLFNPVLFLDFLFVVQLQTIHCNERLKFSLLCCAVMHMTTILVVVHIDTVYVKYQCITFFWTIYLSLLQTINNYIILQVCSNPLVGHVWWQSWEIGLESQGNQQNNKSS